MTTLMRVVVTSSGYIGAPGYNILHASLGTWTELDYGSAAQDFCSNLSSAFQDVQDFLVDELTWTIGPTVQFFRDSDGELIEEVSPTFSNPVITGADTGMYLDRSACMNVALRTNDFVNGRRLIGRSFIGPVGNGAIGSDGQVKADARAAANSMFNGLISGTGCKLAVWHRPTSKTAEDGTYGDVTAVVTRTTPGTIRGRKQ